MIEYGVMLSCVSITLAGVVSSFSEQFVLAANPLTRAMSSAVSV